MAVDKSITSLQVAFTSTADTQVDLGGINKIYLHSITNDCYVDFDQPIAATTSARIFSGDTGYTVIENQGGTIQKLHVKGVTGSGTLYLILLTN